MKYLTKEIFPFLFAIAALAYVAHLKGWV